MDPLGADVERIFREKAQWRRERAKLPIEEKIRIPVRMRERRALILRQRGQKAYVWKIAPSASGPGAEGR